MTKNNKYQDLAPDDLKGHFMLAEPHEEFIVGIDFCYCEVDYKGFSIESCNNLGLLVEGLESDEEIATRNMPRHWEEIFSIEKLRGSIKIHSSDSSDVDAMRALFGDQVGEVSYIEALQQNCYDYWRNQAPDHVDEFYAKLIILNYELFDDNLIKSIDEAAFKYFENYPHALECGTFALGALTELPEKLADIISKFQGDTWLPSVKNVSVAAIRSLSKKNGCITLGLEQIDDIRVAEALSECKCDLELFELVSISDQISEILSKHQGNLLIDRQIKNISNVALNYLAKKKGTIDGINPAEWVAKFLEDNSIQPN